MMIHAKRLLCLVLAVLMVLGLPFTAMAAEPTAPAETEDGSKPTETETTQPTETQETSDISDTPAVMILDDEYGIMTAASTQSGILLFDFSDNGDYTSRLNSQLSVSYKPNGTGTTRTAYIKNLGWHFARYNNTPYADDPLYCIEPWRDYGASTSGNSVDRDVTLTGSGSTTGSNVWYALPEARRNAIGLILLYSDQMWDDSVSVFSVKRDANPNVPLRVATQFLIYEIVCGLRDPSTFNLNSTNECGTAGDIFYNAGATAISNFAPNYNTLVANIQAAMKRPSFTGSSSSSAPTITLTGEETSVYDSNGVLANWSFTDGSGAEFYKSGNTLYITQTGTISESTVFKATQYVPSASSATYNIWYMSGSTYQTTISLASASSGSMNAYFKLKGAPTTGSLSLTKTTEDGKNLSGWQFGIYTNSACTSLAAGPYTTNSSGKISVSGLSAGTYYVKELGHTDSSINALYTCSSTNPQKVTITSGSTASVSFYNKLNLGSVKLVKETNTGENLGGWQIALYTDANCTTQISGSPFTTAQDGTVTVSGLKPQTLYAKEISSGDPYWEYDTEVKTVVVKANETASVTFTNTHYGRIEFRKTTNTGNHLGGWTFRVKDSNYEIVGDYTTDETGYACTENLPLGRYTVIELPTEDNYWTGELGWHDVTVKAGETVVDEWLNKEQGLGWFYKETNTGGDVEGWEITVYRDAACTDEVGTLTTNADGRCGYYLDPGTYWAKETGDTLNRFDDEYWMIDDTIHEFTIKPHEDVSMTFRNIHCGKAKIIKTIDGEGSVAGWQFKVTDDQGNEIEGSPFTTDDNGEILFDAAPGSYTIEELIPENSLYYCKSENPQVVTITAGQTVEVTFTNTLRPGKITVNKVDIRGEPLAGATFLLEWSEDGALWWPVEYSDSDIVMEGHCSNSAVENGCMTSGEDGIIQWKNLYPTLYYRVTEVEAPEGYLLLEDAAFEGQLPTDDLTVSFSVINSRIFTMPDTGSHSLLGAAASLGVCLAGLLGVMLYLRKKER